MSSLLEIVKSFQGLRALVIGDVMLDSYLEGRASRLCREGPVPVVSKTREERVPGGAANTAANLQELGAQVTLLGISGTDAAGEHLDATLKDLGVDTSRVVRDPSVSTLHKLRILANGQYVVRFDEGDTSSCEPHVYQHLLIHLEQEYTQTDLVLISDYGYGVASDRLLDRLRELRRVRPSVLLVDSKDPSRYAGISATMLTPNHQEAGEAVGWRLASDEAPRLSDIEEVGRRLIELTGSEHVAITMASHGVMLLSRQESSLHLPVRPVARAHDVGAGDSFAAATALALAASATPDEAVRIGVDAAGVAVLRERTSIVGHQELLRSVSARLQPQEGEAPDLPLQAVEDARRAGRVVVFTNGVFDILHAGHLGFLRRARALGDMLVVGVNSDASTRRLQGQSRPLISERDRLALVQALDCVDQALIFDEDTPEKLIRRLRPDVHVKGGDYADVPLPEAEAVAEVGGRVVVLPFMESDSTSATRDRIAAISGVDGGDQ